MIKLQRHMPARDAALSVFESHRKALQRLDADAFSTRDIDRLHKFRVALRRSRALLKGMKGVYTKDQIRYYYVRLRDLQRATNLVREIDVLILTIPQLIREGSNLSAAGSEALLTWLSGKREHAWRELTVKLQQPEYTGILQEWIDVLDGNRTPTLENGADGPILDHACSTLSKSLTRLIRNAWSMDESTPLAELHKTRIQVKVMRYQLESYLPIMNTEEANEVRDKLKLIQGRLGEMNDCDTAIRYLTKRRQEVAIAAGEQAADVLDQLVEILELRFLERRALAIQALHDFAGEAEKREGKPPCSTSNG